MVPWRTETVVLLCRSMREARDYSATPVLADALQEAEFADEAVLARLRDPALPAWHAERLVAVIYSDATAAAVARIDAFIVWLGPGGYPDDGGDMTYERLMTVAHAFAANQAIEDSFNSMNWSNATAKPGVEAAFWSDYGTVTGQPIAFEIPEYGTTLFRCSC